MSGCWQPECHWRCVCQSILLLARLCGSSSVPASLFEALVRDLTRRVEAEVSTAEQSVYRGSAALFYSPEACRLKEEIIEVGRKLWELAEYVDGAGGNISVRLGSGHVLCTPTMRSKRDLTPDDICMTDAWTAK